jgi:K+-transporting ATPase ATPase B chain
MDASQKPITTKPPAPVTLRRKWPHRVQPPANGGTRAEPAYGADLLLSALADSLRKFDPRVQIHNPVMFVVWLGALVTAALTVAPTLFGPSSGSGAYNGAVTAILVLTV